MGRRGERRLAGAAACLAACLCLHHPAFAPSGVTAATSALRSGGPRSASLAGAEWRTRRLPGVAARAADNPYDVLGLPRGTDKEETRRLFRRRALKEHPDVNPEDPEAEERFQKLVGAYNSIMGDEILPDELMEIRVQATKRYQERMKAELRGGADLVFMGNARLIQGVAQVVFFLGLLWLANNPDMMESLLSPPVRNGF